MDRNEPVTLKQTCFHAVRKQFPALDSRAITDLPVALIQDLLPQLTVSQLNQLQPALNRKGISTHSGWAVVLKNMYGPDYPVDRLTEDKAKEEVMRRLFTHIFYGSTKPFVKKIVTDLNTSSFLLTAARYMEYFPVYPNLQKPLQSLSAEQQTVLNLLEKQIRSVGVPASADISTNRTQTALYVLHRLLDHGVANKLIVNKPSPTMLAWLLQKRGSRYVSPMLEKLMLGGKEGSVSADGAGCSSAPETLARENEDKGVMPCKRPRLEFEERRMDPRVVCGVFSWRDDPSAGTCPRGQIESLEVRQCGINSIRVLTSCLPTFFCLRSLTLHCLYTIEDSDMLDLTTALKRLSASPHSCLAHLSISNMHNTRVLGSLMDAVPKVTSLHVEVMNVLRGSHHHQSAKPDLSELSLQRLTIKVAELQTDLCFITLALRRSPHLTSLHIAGLILPPGSSLRPLFTTLSESIRCLKSLNLEDVNLSNCLPQILSLLRDCQLEELRFADCRLLEKCSDKEESLQQLVCAVRTVSSLHTLSLAQNRLAKNVSVLSELFSGSCPSSVKHLDISSNYIQPAELLELAHRLRRHRPPQRLTLDLSMNPGDRDPDRWNAALNLLRPFCVLLLRRWRSTDTMVDHISNM